MDVAVSDIDGVVADVQHRLHFLAPGVQDWEQFYNAADADGLLQQGRDQIDRLKIANKIIWITGRPERLRDVTTHWLQVHQLPTDDLRMHPGNFQEQPTRQFKLHVVEDIARTHNVTTVLDDDPKVVELLEQAGLPAILTTWSLYIPTYQRLQQD